MIAVKRLRELLDSLPEDAQIVAFESNIPKSDIDGGLAIDTLGEDIEITVIMPNGDCEFIRVIEDKEKDQQLKNLAKEDLTKSFTHDRPAPDTEPPRKRVTSQDAMQLGTDKIIARMKDK